MILKNFQRKASGSYIRHLLNGDDNEQVFVVRSVGFASGDDLRGCWAEMDAMAVGTKCKEPVAELVIRRHAQQKADPAEMEKCRSAYEKRMGLEGQPYIIVAHIKDGVQHWHVLWSRIQSYQKTPDGPTRYRAINLPFTHIATMELSFESFQRTGFPPPPGLVKFMEGRDPAKRRPKLEISRPIWAAIERTGLEPQATVSAIRACKTAKNMQIALAKCGFVLCQGDRGALVVTATGEHIGTLGKLLDLKQKDVRALLGKMDLPTLEEVRRDGKTIAQEPKPEPAPALAEAKKKLDAVKRGQKEIRQQQETLAAAALVEHHHLRKQFANSTAAGSVTVFPGLDKPRPAGIPVKAWVAEIMAAQITVDSDPSKNPAAVIENARRALRQEQHRTRQPLVAFIRQRRAEWQEAVRGWYVKTLAHIVERMKFTERITGGRPEAAPEWSHHNPQPVKPQTAQKPAPEAENVDHAAYESAADHYVPIEKTAAEIRQEKEAQRRADLLNNGASNTGRATGRGGGGRGHTPQIKKPSGPSV